MAEPSADDAESVSDSWSLHEILDGSSAEAVSSPEVEQNKSAATKVLVTEDEIKAALEKLSTSQLEGAYWLYPPSMRLGEEGPFSKCSLTPSELDELAKPIIAERKRRQKQYRDKLKKLVNNKQVWKSRSSGRYPGPRGDYDYERWLDESNDLAVPRPDMSGFVVQPLSHQGTEFFENVYALDLSSKGRSCGAVIIDDKKLDVRLMCELGDRLSIKPEVFVDFVTNNPEYPWQSDSWKVDGVLLADSARHQRFVMGKNIANKISEPPFREARVLLCATKVHTKLLAPGRGQREDDAREEDSFCK